MTDQSICYTCAYTLHVVPCSPYLSSRMQAEKVGAQAECVKFTPCTALTSEITAAVIKLGADFGVKVVAVRCRRAQGIQCNAHCMFDSV